MERTLPGPKALAQIGYVRRLSRDPQPVLEFKGFNDDEQRQLRDNAKFWRRRLDAIPREIEREPKRIQQSYAVRATRIEPVGIAYLWPVTG